MASEMAAGRLDAVAQILARGILRVLASDAATRPAATSAWANSQERGAVSESSNLVAFLSDKSVHVQTAATEGVAL